MNTHTFIDSKCCFYAKIYEANGSNTTGNSNDERK